MNGPMTRYAQMFQAVLSGLFAMFEDTNLQVLFAVPFALLIIFIVPAIFLRRRNG